MSEEKLAEKTESEALDQNVDQDGKQDETEAEEFEITLGDSPSQDSRKKGNPMVARIIGQRDSARDEVAQLKSEIALLKANKSATPSTKEPSWDDYGSDEEYRQAVLKWAQSQQKQPNPIDQIQQFQRQQQFSQRVDGHYQRAQSLAEKFPEYSQAEQAAVEVLGQELASDIAARAKNSAELLLYFGKNSAKAREFKHLADTDPVEAALELGRLDASLKVQARAKAPLPDPDEPLDGGRASSQGSWQRKLDKARDANDIKGAIAIKKQARAEGFNLE